MISLARYAALLAAREVRQIYAVSLLGRLPIGITGLAVLILVQSASGSFAAGGATTGAYVAGLALVAPLFGRLIDRYGPNYILLASALAFPAALALLTIAVAQGGPAWLTLVAAAGAGACFPPITVCMRTYFKQRFGDDVLLGTAYSLESVLIELIFIAGPMLVALFVAYASAAAAVGAAAACGSLGALLFARSPAIRAWKIEPRPAASLLGPLGERGFVPLIAVVLCFSTAFGLLEIGATAYAIERGAPAFAGVLLGLMSVGSAVGGIAYGTRSWHFPLARQFATMLALMAGGLALLALPWGPWLFAAWSLLAGVVMAPALIVQSMLVARTARPAFSTEAFTWSASALLAGVGIGLAVGGVILETNRSEAAFATAAAASLLAALTARALLR
ncbi:MAG TPA: MFS transporter [Burkholderiales bacterium]